MQIEIDDGTVDSIVIQSLKDDRRILSNILTGDEDDDYTKAVIEAIDVVLGYYIYLPLKDRIDE